MKLLLGLLLLLVIALAASTAYFAMELSNEREDNETEETKVDEEIVEDTDTVDEPIDNPSNGAAGSSIPADWETYTDEENGYEISYSNTLTVKEEDSRGEKVVTLEGEGGKIFMSVKNEALDLVEIGDEVFEAELASFYVTRGTSEDGCYTTTYMTALDNGKILHIEFPACEGETDLSLMYDSTMLSSFIQI